jgi:plastocyanin
MRRVVLLTLAGLLAVGVSGAGAAVTRDVKALNSHFSPHRIIAVTDDSVRWTNNDAIPHTVTPFFSGNLMPGTPQTWVFNTQGTFPYECTFHYGMTGTVAVYNLYFAGPVSSVLYGKTAAMSGYAPDNSSVTINRMVNGTPNLVTSVTSNGMGRFTKSIPAVPGLYRADTGTRISALVRVNVKPRLAVTSRRKGKAYWITISTNPNQSGAKVVLERKKGFSWRKLATHTLGSGSKTVFKVVPTTRMSVRLRLTAPVGGYAKNTSGTLTLRP